MLLNLPTSVQQWDLECPPILNQVPERFKPDGKSRPLTREMLGK